MKTSLRSVIPSTTVCVLALALASLLIPAASVRADILYVANAGVAVPGTIEKFNALGVGSVFANVGGDQPLGMAFDGARNLFVSDYPSATIKKYTPSGVVSVFASRSSGLDGPAGLAFDKAGNLYVANSVRNNILKYTPGGAVSVFVPAFSGLVSPTGLAFDSAGNLFIANRANDTIDKVTPGGVVSIFANLGVQSGPDDLAFDIAGNLYVTDSADHLVEKYTSNGVGSVFASGGFSGGPYGLAFDSAMNLYVTNDGTPTTIEKITPSGVRSVFAGAGTGLVNPGHLAFTDNNGVPLLQPGGVIVAPEPSTGIMGIALCLPALLARRRKA